MSTLPEEPRPDPTAAIRSDHVPRHIAPTTTRPTRRPRSRGESRQGGGRPGPPHAADGFGQERCGAAAQPARNGRGQGLAGPGMAGRGCRTGVRRCPRPSVRSVGCGTQGPGAALGRQGRPHGAGGGRYGPTHERRRIDIALRGLRGHRADRTARGQARSFLAALRTVHRLPVSDRAADLVELVVSELVTNSRKYAPGPCLLTLVLREDCVEVSVWDGNPVLPSVLPPDPYRVGQHGLEIVMAAAQAFRIEREGVGKRVTAAIALVDP